MKKKAFAEKFRELPRPMEVQIWIRLGLGVLGVLIGTVFAVCAGIYIGIPWLMLAVYMSVNGLLLLKTGVEKRFTVIRGRCRAVEASGLLKRTRSVILLVDEIPLRVRLHQKRTSLQPGDAVVIYTSDKTPVYAKDGCDYLCGYYAMEIVEAAE